MISKRVIALMLFIAIPCSSSWPYDVGVHERISHEAIDSSRLDGVLKTQLGLRGGIETKLREVVINGRPVQSAWQWVAFGGQAEDFGYFGMDNPLTTRAFNHFHDPLRDWDQAGLDDYVLELLYWGSYVRFPVSPILWGLKPGQQDFLMNRTGDWSWGKAREYYHAYLTGRDFEGKVVALTDDERKANLASSLQALGQVMHLLQDMSVPLHTRNDVHVFPLVKVNTGYPLQRWTYETYTKERLKHLDFIPDQNGDRPGFILLDSPQPEAIPQDYSHLPPITGLFDRNQYDGDEMPSESHPIGLAEYSNANFLTQDTIWTYPHPSLDDTDYATVDWLNPEQVTAEDGRTDNRIYIRKVLGERIGHLVATDYWSFDYWDVTDSVPSPFSLDEMCWKDYSGKLIPRAVGYSAALLDYFFRGTLEISAPDEFLYSIIDGGKLPQVFKHMKAKVKNTSPREKNEEGEVISYEEVGPGTLVAVAKYKKRTNYQSDLSADPPTVASREANFSYSVSLPINIDSLDTETATEFVFDFSYTPIPVGITDLYLQVVFKGTLGNELDNAIAVGMKDLNEPMHVVSWNSTDRFYLYGHLYTPQEIRSNEELLNLIPTEFNIDPYDGLETGVAFYCGEVPLYYNAYTPNLPSGRFSRIIILTDTPSFNIFVGYYSASPPKDSYFEETVSEVINQEDETGSFLPAPVVTFRGKKAHLWYTLWNFYPVNVGIQWAPWPGPTSQDPVPTEIYFP